MVINGSSRNNAGQLADYLVAQAENEFVYVIEGSQNLKRDLLRMERITRATTQATNTVYHAQLSPKPGEELSEAQWHQAADILCKELGFPEHQPRVLVIHQKRGKDGQLRTHAHLVIQRYEPAQGLVRDSYNFLAHERAAQECERVFGLEKTRRKDRQVERHAERKLSSQEVNHLIGEAWENSNSPDEFRARLQDNGLTLCYAQAGKNNRDRSGQGKHRGRSQNQNAFAVVGRSGDYYRIRPTLLYDENGQKLNRAKMKAWMKDLSAPVPSYSQAKENQLERLRLVQEREKAAGQIQGKEKIVQATQEALDQLARDDIEQKRQEALAEQARRLEEAQRRFEEEVATYKREKAQELQEARHDFEKKHLTPGEEKKRRMTRRRKRQSLEAMSEAVQRILAEHMKKVQAFEQKKAADLLQEQEKIRQDTKKQILLLKRTESRLIFREQERETGNTRDRDRDGGREREHGR